MSKLFTRRVLGVDIVVASFRDVVNYIESSADSDKGSFIFLATAKTLLSSRRDPKVHAVLKKAQLVCHTASRFSGNRGLRALKMLTA